jgi:hypothetical protein
MYFLFVGYIYPVFWAYIPVVLDIYAGHTGYIFVGYMSPYSVKVVKYKLLIERM